MAPTLFIAAARRSGGGAHSHGGGVSMSPAHGDHSHGGGADSPLALLFGAG